MSALVPHLRPEFDTSSIRAGHPVSSSDWSNLGGLANWSNGHGKMLIPWACCRATLLQNATETFRFRIAPSARAVERVWFIKMYGTLMDTVTVTCGSLAAQTVRVTQDPQQVYVFREPLSAKTNTVAETSVVIETPAAGEFASLDVYSIAMYEQTRAALDLDTTDYGVDLTTLRVRQPIADIDNRSAGGVYDAYANLDAKRAGVFHWACPNDPIETTSTSLVDIFPLQIPFAGAIVSTGGTTTTVRCFVLAKVTSGSGTITVSSAQAGASSSITVTQTAYTAWQETTLAVQTEDLAITDGRRGNVWESIRVQMSTSSGAVTLSCQSISIIRSTTRL